MNMFMNQFSTFVLCFHLSKTKKSGGGGNWGGVLWFFFTGHAGHSQ